MTEEQQYSMQEREKEQYDWKVSKLKTTPPHKKLTWERERARRQWELVVSINNLCPKHHQHHHQQRRSIASSIGLKRHWNTTMRERERATSSVSIMTYRWAQVRVWERESQSSVCMMEELTSYHTTRRTRRRRLCWYCWCWWCAWVKSCVWVLGHQARSAFNQGAQCQCLTHTVCLVGRVTIERELAVS